MNDEMENEVTPLDAERLIGTIVKNEGAIIIRLNVFKGKRYVDVRKFTQNKTDQKYYPTQKGISIECADLTELLNSLERVEAELAAEQPQVFGKGLAIKNFRKQYGL